MIFITVPSEEVAIKLSKILIENRVAACVNILPGIRSIYRWEGKICDENELLLIVKTRTDLFQRVCELVKENHPYKVPEIIEFVIKNGSRDYLNWICSETQ